MATTKIEHARFVVTMDPSRRIIRDGTVIVDGPRITHVSKADELAGVPADRTVDAHEMVVTPGFVNGHIHVSYAHAFRGAFAEDTEQSEYFRAIFAVQAAMDESEEYQTTLLAITELLKGGTTTFLDPGSTKFLDAGLQAYTESGCRVVTGLHVTDQPNPANIPTYEPAEAIQLTDDAIRRYHGRLEGRVNVWAMPFSDDWASDELLQGLKRLVDSHGTGLTLHHINRPESVERTLKAFGERPTNHMESIGLLGPNVLLAHVIDLDAGEIDAMARTGTSAVVCPPAFLKLAQGGITSSKLPEMLANGVAVAFGTDSANNGNLIEVAHSMHVGALLYKDARSDVSLLPAEQVLEMGTILGAQALGLADDIGSLEPGKRADMVLFDTRRVEWRTLHNPVNALVYNADGRSVHTVLVDGNVVVEGGRPTFVDEGALVDRTQEMAERLLARTGVTPTIRWPIE